MTQRKWWCLLLALTVPSSRVWTADQAVGGDPTRPPSAVMRAATPAAQPSDPGGRAPDAAALAAASASAASKPAVRRKPRLTLVRVDERGGRGVALIDGRAVSVGDRVGDATVAVIDKQGVVLRNARGSMRLALLPAMDRQAVEAAASAASESEQESP